MGRFFWPMNFLLVYLYLLFSASPILLPVSNGNRSVFHTSELTAIGHYGLVRKERVKAQVKAHLHTGIDLKRPSKNYTDEPVFPVADGIVISVRCDGPFAEIIMEHHGASGTYWSLYDHIAGIKVVPGDKVFALKPFARFMDRKELNRFGWQFDHVHLELLKSPPRKVKPDKSLPQRHFVGYTLECYSIKELEKYYWNPEIWIGKIP